MFNQSGLGLQPAAGYKVTVYKPGAFVAQADVSNVIQVQPEHGFVKDDMLYQWNNFAQTFVSGSLRQVTTAAATEITITGAPLNVALYDVLVNVGEDTGSGDPAFNGSPLVVYPVPEPPDKSLAFDEATVTTDNNGVFYYWHDEQRQWEVVRDTQGSPISVNIINPFPGTTLFGISDTSPNGTPGSPSQYVEAYDKDGKLLGYMAIYPKWWT